TLRLICVSSVPEPYGRDWPIARILPVPGWTGVTAVATGSPSRRAVVHRRKRWARLCSRMVEGYGQPGYSPVRSLALIESTLMKELLWPPEGVGFSPYCPPWQPYSASRVRPLSTPRRRRPAHSASASRLRCPRLVGAPTPCAPASC